MCAVATSLKTGMFFIMKLTHQLLKDQIYCINKHEERTTHGHFTKVSEQQAVQNRQQFQQWP
jgi:hypothetical protein